MRPKFDIAIIPIGHRDYGKLWFFRGILRHVKYQNAKLYHPLGEYLKTVRMIY